MNPPKHLWSAPQVLNPAALGPNADYSQPVYLPYAQYAPAFGSAPEEPNYELIYDQCATPEEYVLKMDENKWPNPFPKPWLLSAPFWFSWWREKRLLHSYFNLYAMLIKGVHKTEAQMAQRTTEVNVKQAQNASFANAVEAFVDNLENLDPDTVRRRYNTNFELKRMAGMYGQNSRTINRHLRWIKRATNRVTKSRRMAEDVLERITMIRDDKQMEREFVAAARQLKASDPALVELVEMEEKAEELYFDYDDLQSDVDDRRDVSDATATAADPFLEMILQAVQKRAKMQAEFSGVHPVPDTSNVGTSAATPTTSTTATTWVAGVQTTVS